MPLLPHLTAKLASAAVSLVVAGSVGVTTGAGVVLADRHGADAGDTAVAAVLGDLATRATPPAPDVPDGPGDAADANVAAAAEAATAVVVRDDDGPADDDRASDDAPVPDTDGALVDGAGDVALAATTDVAVAVDAAVADTATRVADAVDATRGQVAALAETFRSAVDRVRAHVGGAGTPDLEVRAGVDAAVGLDVGLG